MPPDSLVSQAAAAPDLEREERGRRCPSLSLQSDVPTRLGPAGVNLDGAIENRRALERAGRSCPRGHGVSWRHSMVTPSARVIGLLGENVVAVVPVVMPLALAQLTAAW